MPAGRQVYRITYFVLLAFVFMSASFVVQAITPIATDSAGQVEATSSSSISKEVQKLKENLVNKVAQIQKKELRVVVGKVTEVGKTSIKVTAEDSTVFTVSLDEVVTKYYSLKSGSKKDLEKSDVSKGDYVIVAGVVNDTKVSANSIYIDTQVLVGSGTVATVDKTDFSLVVNSFTHERYTIDIESATKISLLDSKTLELESAGFSKIKEGDAVHFVLTVSGKEKEKNRYSAQKLLIIPQEYFQK
ncbi:MAG: hypothetical protein QG551_209 [Patescibacteria group bacterium]|nr:hypothetical protein [Patescibacteria group bacterium]